MYDPRRSLEKVDGVDDSIVWNSINVGWAQEAVKSGKKLKKHPFFDNKPYLRRGEIVFQPSDKEVLTMFNSSMNILKFAP